MSFTTARKKLLICSLLGLLIWFAYWPVLRCGFVNYDDPGYVTQNPIVQSGLTLKSAWWAFANIRASSTPPLTWLSHMANVQFFGMRAWGHHLTNVLLHTANAALLFLLLSRMTGAMWQSALVAGLFAVHPLQVESVAWVAERKGVLSTFFFMLTLLAYVKYAKGDEYLGSGRGGKSEGHNPKSRIQNPKAEAGHSKSGVRGSKRGLWYGLALFLFALGLMSKPTLVIVPLVMWLLDWWPLERFAHGPTRISRLALPALVTEKVPFLVLSAASCLLTITEHLNEGVLVTLNDLPMSARVGNAIVSLARYLGGVFWPVRLAVLYPHPGRWPFLAVLAALALLSGLSLCALWLCRRRPYVLAGWLWFLIALLPVIGLIQAQEGRQAMADRYMYVPIIGLFLVISWAGGEMAGRGRSLKLVLISAAVFVLTAFLFRTQDQLQYWRTSETLFRRALAVTRNNMVAHYNLGCVLSDAGNWEEAADHYVQALLIEPQFTDAQVNYAIVLARLGKSHEARARLAKVLLQNPADPAAHFNLGIALGLTGDTAMAINHYREGLRLKPDWPDALNNLAWIRAAHSNAAFRDGTEAVHLAHQACELTRFQRPVMVGTLAAAYAEAGRFDEAIAAAQNACNLALASGQNDLAGQNQKLLELYQAHQPYHDPAEPQQ
ncbi:MAG: tetratricopeptide repeat protein [Verrucomicrobiota bacterium]